MVLLRFVSLSHRIILSIFTREFLSAFVGKKREGGAFLLVLIFFLCATQRVMPLIYAFVAATRNDRTKTILAEYTAYSGNFSTIATQVRRRFRRVNVSPSSRLNFFFPSNNGHEKRACALASSSSRIVRSPLAPPLERSNETTPGVRESPAIRLGQVHVQRGQTHV